MQIVFGSKGVTANMNTKGVKKGGAAGNDEVYFERQDRIDWIDAARCFAIFCVVVNHAIESIYKFEVEDFIALSTVSQFFALASFTFGRLGVPLFLMISGYLLLDRDWNQESCFKFWKNNWLRLFVCTEIWWVIYDVFITVYYKTPLDIVRLIQRLLFLTDVNMLHAWYMPMILGMYILIPMAGTALQKFETKHLFFPIIVFSGYSFAYPVLALISSAIGYPLKLRFSFGFSGGAFGLYLFYGYLTKKNFFYKISKNLVAIAFMGAFCLTVIFQFCGYKFEYAYKAWYDNGFLAICTVALMVLFSKVLPSPTSIALNNKSKRLVRILARDSFGIYLIHMPILIAINPFISSIIKFYPIQFACLALADFILSWALVEFCCKIPVIGKILFYLKS